jgi:hypothetical protein
MTPTARELLRDMEPRDEAGMILAARVERVLALPWSEDSVGYNEGLAKVRRILDGEGDK